MTDMTDISDTPITTSQPIFKITDAIRGVMGEGCRVIRVSGRSDYSDDDEWPGEIIIGYDGKDYGFAIGVQKVFLLEDEHQMIIEQRAMDDRTDY